MSLKQVGVQEPGVGSKQVWGQVYDHKAGWRSRNHVGDQGTGFGVKEAGLGGSKNQEPVWGSRKKISDQETSFGVRELVLVSKKQVWGQRIRNQFGGQGSRFRVKEAGWGSRNKDGVEGSRFRSRNKFLGGGSRK